MSARETLGWRVRHPLPDFPDYRLVKDKTSYMGYPHTYEPGRGTLFTTFSEALRASCAMAGPGKVIRIVRKAKAPAPPAPVRTMYSALPTDPVWFQVQELHAPGDWQTVQLRCEGFDAALHLARQCAVRTKRSHRIVSYA
jgi:hypothetical protein